ncbi:PaeR7I family type II restriction endonuclease [Vibrio splendidus]
MKQDIQKATKLFWDVRKAKGVRSGKTLDGFRDVIQSVVESSGLENVSICVGKNDSQLPGYFRPHKSWDVVILSDNKLVAAIELKSQVGSIGNNFNNRAEEVLGSGIDLFTAVQEEAFGDDAEVFRGYLILVEDSEQTRKSAKVNMSHFQVTPGFLNDETERTAHQRNKKGVYPPIAGVSYLKRYEMLCKRLVLKNLYTATGLVLLDMDNKGDYRDYTSQTSIETFLQKLRNHCDLLATY